jgi:hypothetical protein
MKREHEFKMQQIALEKGIEMQAKQAEEQEDVPVT